MAINKTKYKNKVEVIAKAERGKIKPVFSPLKNLIFLLITLTIFSKSLIQSYLSSKALTKDLINFHNKKILIFSF